MQSGSWFFLFPLKSNTCKNTHVLTAHRGAASPRPGREEGCPLCCQCHTESWINHVQLGRCDKIITVWRRWGRSQLQRDKQLLSHPQWQAHPTACEESGGARVQPRDEHGTLSCLLQYEPISTCSQSCWWVSDPPGCSNRMGGVGVRGFFPST